MQTSVQQKHFSKLIKGRLQELDLPSKPALLYDPVRYTLSLPGKHVRPYLTLIGCGLCGGDPEEALQAAISIELLHNFTLLHDDIMDRAETRRGEPSVYKKWDSETAILSGDAMYAKAFQQLQFYGKNQKYSKETYAVILDIFLESAETVCEGQAYDLTFETETSVSIDQYLHMIEGKTASLISGALTIGGAVSETSGDCLEELSQLGKKIGIAFQIQDDLLDVVADPDKFGKKRGGDIIEGKKTYLSLLALQRCNNKHQQQLLTILDDKKVSAEDIDNIISTYRDLNVISDTKSVIQNYYQTALNHLQKFQNSQYKDEINLFLHRLIKREF